MVKQNFGDGQEMPWREPVYKNIAAQQANISLVENCAKQAGLGLDGFLSNNSLELYYNIHRDGNSVCYLYKGWADPGFRIGCLIDMKKSHKNFTENLEDFSKICSKYMLTKTIGNSSMEDCVQVIFETGIYTDGFNGKVLGEAMENMEEAVAKIRLLLAAD